jgi:hypothetical protein
MLNDPFQDDPLPPTPMPTSAPAEVRRAPDRQMKPASAPRNNSASTTAPSSNKPATATASSPFKVVKEQTAAAPPKTTVRRPASTITAKEEIRTITARSVLRQASAETEVNEPARHNINRARALPIVRSQSPDHNEQEIPLNPLR